MNTALSQLPWKQFLCFLGMSTVCLSLHGQVRECRDSEGKKIFASVCPKGATQVRDVEILKPPTETKEVKEQKALTLRRLYEQDQINRTKEANRQEAEGAARDAQRQLSNKCYEDRKKLSALLIVAPIEVGQEKDGTPIFLEDKKRLDMIKEMSERLQKCPEEQAQNGKN